MIKISWANSANFMAAWPAVVIHDNKQCSEKGGGNAKHKMRTKYTNTCTDGPGTLLHNVMTPKLSTQLHMMLHFSILAMLPGLLLLSFTIKHLVVWPFL